MTATDVAAAPSPTAALLWAASRPQVDPNAVASALARGADVARAAELAVAQRLSPLLWRALTAASPYPDPVPAGAATSVATIRADAARCRAQAQLVLPALARHALEPLTDAGYEPVVMKGAAIADRYPEPGLRPMDDVDVLLPSPAHRGALDVLNEAGWTRQHVPGRHYEVRLTHPAVPGLPLELHRSFATWSSRANRLSAPVLWRRRRPQNIGGVDAFGFAPEDELVALAAHAAKPFHVFGRLLWLTDIAVVVAAAEAAGTPIEWDEVRRVADEGRCRTATAVALTIAERLGAESPADLRRLPATGARLAALAPLLSTEWPLRDHDEGLRNRLRYALVDDRRLRATLLVESVVHPSPVTTTRRAVDTSRRLVRRWRQLRRSGDGGSEEVGHRVEP